MQQISIAFWNYSLLYIESLNTSVNLFKIVNIVHENIRTLNRNFDDSETWHIFG